MSANPFENGRSRYVQRYAPQLQMLGTLEPPNPLLKASYEGAAETLKANLNHQFWIGPDIALAENSTFAYGWNEVPVILTPNHLPRLDDLPPESLWLLNLSTRSRLAQSGVDLEGLTIPNGPLGIEPHQWHALKQGRSQIAHASLFAHAPISLPQHTGLFRYFSPTASEIQKDDDLRELVKSGAVSISGEEGKDWNWIIFNHHSYGIQVRLDPSHKWWIPPQDNNQPLKFPRGHNFHQAREALESVLQPVFPALSDFLRANGHGVFWVGETLPTITIHKPGINAMVDVGGLLEDPRFGERFSVPTRHNMSPLLEGPTPNGQLVTNGKIRVEIVSIPNEVNSVPIIFFRDGSPQLLQFHHAAR